MARGDSLVLCGRSTARHLPGTGAHAAHRVSRTGDDAPGRLRRTSTRSAGRLPGPAPAQPAAYPTAPPPAAPAAAPAAQAAPPALAPAAPPAWWSSYRPRSSSSRESAKVALEVTGSVLSGLGAMTLMAGGSPGLWRGPPRSTWTRSSAEPPLRRGHAWRRRVRGHDRSGNATDVLLAVALPAIAWACRS